MTSAKLLTAVEAAQLKGVTRGAIYAAVRDGRLPHHRVMGHLALCETDVLAWTPKPYMGRRKGSQLSDESKQRISRAQKQRWAKRRAIPEENTSQE